MLGGMEKVCVSLTIFAYLALLLVLDCLHPWLPSWVIPWYWRIAGWRWFFAIGAGPVELCEGLHRNVVGSPVPPLGTILSSLTLRTLCLDGLSSQGVRQFHVLAISQLSFSSFLLGSNEQVIKLLHVWFGDHLEKIFDAPAGTEL